ncbi:MAG: methylenetetrahydrofolate reductase [Verrucomicrobia bacterium]|nr:methylenetetrahydrofolate reductase [Verrucomicrobiota bacterium]
MGSSRVVILEFLRAMESMGITRILALRGDPPQDQTNYQPAADAFRYASDLVTFLRAHSTMQIAVAAYPEKHPQAETLETDMTHLRGKVDAGACKIITQLFYDNSRYLEFVARARRQGITIPIIPGLLPLIQHQQIEKFVKLSQASIPPALMKIIAQTEGNDLAMKTAGMDFARRQIRELLAAGVPGIHFYTLNKSEIALQVLDEFFP